MTEQQKAFIKQTAWEVGDRIMERMQKALDDRVEAHSNECEVERLHAQADTGEKQSDKFWKLFAILISLVALGLGALAAYAK